MASIEVFGCGCLAAVLHKGTYRPEVVGRRKPTKHRQAVIRRSVRRATVPPQYTQRPPGGTRSSFAGEIGGEADAATLRFRCSQRCRCGPARGHTGSVTRSGRRELRSKAVRLFRNASKASPQRAIRRCALDDGSLGLLCRKPVSVYRRKHAFLDHSTALASHKSYPRIVAHATTTKEECIRLFRQHLCR